MVRAGFVISLYGGLVDTDALRCDDFTNLEKTARDVNERHQSQ
jgi:hypothetical protein